ncbi:hypothetical protein MYX84_04145 [Acidobacteria bacterium AH-259-O06]|nr:hypothetical protein [Acidobacteria bacterium AH-259-O06]
MCLTLLLLFLVRPAVAGKSDYFKITVVDEETGRGVPLVELKTTSGVRYYTDSNGIVAFYEPGLMDQLVYFHIKSHGYEFPEDGFGYGRGKALKVARGASALIKIKRLNIAERLYRITGAGIYRDSILVGHPVPIRHPLLNGKVLGQDTVVSTVYRGKIYWFGGDTVGPYNLNLAVAGATSELPQKGGLDPSAGVDLTYFVNESGFTKEMCPFPVPGLKWLEGLMTITDETGSERLLARYASMKDLGYAHEWGLAIFNDDKQVFEQLVRFELHGPHRSAHPFRATVKGQDYYYIFPNFRVKADLKHLKDLSLYEAFTPLKSGVRYDRAAPQLGRAPDGRLRYAWKSGTDPVHRRQQRELIAEGQMKAGEEWLRLYDIERGVPIRAGPGSVSWNEFRTRWIMIAGGKPGEVWYAEADTPVGPWVYAQKIVSHDKYNFYNVTQHPFFDQQGGRIIYFEGTYTEAFSASPEKTPRYDYNQIMYRLKLDDPRLFLPVPVYQLKGVNGAKRYLLGKAVDSQNTWESIEEVAFFALPPDRRWEGFIPIFATMAEGGVTLQREPPTRGSDPDQPALYALPTAFTSLEEKLTGTWRCKARDQDSSELPFILEINMKGEEIKWTPPVDSLMIINWRVKDGTLELNVKDNEDQATYVLTASLEQSKLIGEWKQSQTGDTGTWEGHRTDFAWQQLASPAVVPLYEYHQRDGHAHFYSANPDIKEEALQRSAEPICRVWRNPMAMLILDWRAKPK